MTRVAPFGLLRVAAMPISLLHALTPPGISADTARLTAELGAMADLGGSLETALHDVVPSLDRRARATALAIRRCVHNRRSIVADGGHVATILAAMPAAHGRVLREWLGHADTYRTGLAAAQVRYEHELDSRLRPALHALARDEAFLKPVAMASPTLCNALRATAGSARGRSPASRMERSILLFALRAAAKTSPFSLFMHNALVEVTDDATWPDLDPDDRDARVHVDRAVLYTMHRQATGTAAELGLNESITWRQDGELTLSVPEDRGFGDRMLRLGRTTCFRLHPVVARQLQDLSARFTSSRLEQALRTTGLDSASARQLAARLRDRGVVMPEPFTDVFDPYPEKRCLAAIRASGRVDALTAANDVIDAARRLPGAPPGERAAFLSRLTEVNGHPEGPSRKGLIHEDAFFREPVGAAGVRGLLRELGDALRPDVAFTAPYLALRKLFLTEFGTRGRCRDLPAFMALATARLGHGSWWRADPEADAAPVHGNSPVHVSVTVQFEADDRIALASGSGTIVLNECYPGNSWLAARHAVGDAPFHERLRHGLRTWLASAYAPREPVDLLISTECNTLQAHPPLTGRAVRFPPEPATARQPWVVPLTQVSLHLDPIDGTLCLTDRNGVDLAPVYLGTTVPQPLWGEAFWLATLAWPHRIRRPIHELRPPADAAAAVSAVPRRAVGRVLLHRASWWATSDWLQKTWYRRDGMGRLVDVADACRTHGIPRHVFVHAPRTAGPTADTDHKPLWVDTGNPFCLDVLKPVLSRTPWLRIAEALPATPVWPLLDGEPHVAELLVDLTI